MSQDVLLFTRGDGWSIHRRGETYVATKPGERELVGPLDKIIFVLNHARK